MRSGKGVKPYGSLSLDREQLSKPASSNGLAREEEGFEINILSFGFRQGVEGQGNYSTKRANTP
jgi:RNase adaptor protein for sRNA GlmZ degradation